jgi:hypothetical protein
MSRSYSHSSERFTGTGRAVLLVSKGVRRQEIKLYLHLNQGMPFVAGQYLGQRGRHRAAINKLRGGYQDVLRHFIS